MMRVVAVLCMALALGACQTKYAEYDGNQGVSAYPMGGNLYRITARGNEYTDDGVVVDQILLKAAETALQGGLDTFAIIDAVDNSRRSVSRTPAMASTALIGGTAMTFVTPSQTHVATLSGAHVMVMVGNLKPGEQLRPGMYNARQTYDAINPRVQRAPK